MAAPHHLGPLPASLGHLEHKYNALQMSMIVRVSGMPTCQYVRPCRAVVNSIDARHSTLRSCVGVIDVVRPYPSRHCSTSSQNLIDDA